MYSRLVQHEICPEHSCSLHLQFSEAFLSLLQPASQPRQSLLARQTTATMARVYADVNQNMPRSYWDYDSVNISTFFIFEKAFFFWDWYYYITYHLKDLRIWSHIMIMILDTLLSYSSALSLSLSLVLHYTTLHKLFIYLLAYLRNTTPPHYYIIYYILYITPR